MNFLINVFSSNTVQILQHIIHTIAQIFHNIVNQRILLLVVKI